MARVELNIVALGDFSVVNSQIAKLRENVAALNAQVMGVGVSPALATSLKAVNAEFKASLLSSGAFTAKTVQLTSETEKFGQSLVRGKLKLGEYFSIIKAGAANSTAAMKALAMEQTKLMNSMVMADPLKRGMFSVITPTTINAVTSATKLATVQQNLYNIAVERGSLSLINWGKNTQWAGRQMTVGLTMPMVMFGAVAAKMFNDVTKEIVRMQKVYGTGLTAPTEEQLSKITKQVQVLSRELATSWGTAAKETAKMAADLAATGLTGDNLIGGTREALRLSKLGELDQESSMTTVVALQNVYKLSTDELRRSVDFLNAVENQTSTSLQDLAGSIPKVGPIVKQLGGDFKDTAAMLVAMKEAGVPAAQGANAIKSALASLINPSDKAAASFEKYGINLKSISEVSGGKPVVMLQMLQQQLAKLEPLARAQLIEGLFGKYQFARVSALLDNMNRLGTQTATVFSLMGATDAQLSKMSQKELDIQTKSATGKFLIAIETIKADLIPIGEKFIAVFTLILKVVDKVIKAFDSLGPLKTLLGLVAGVGMVVGPIVMLTGVFANFIGYVAKSLFNVRAYITGSRTAKELLTAESIAAHHAAELMSSDVMKEADAMNLLTVSLEKLNTQLAEMIGLQAAASGQTMVGAAVASTAGRMGTLPMQIRNGVGITTTPDVLRKAHTGGRLGADLSYAQMKTAMDEGNLKIIKGAETLTFTLTEKVKEAFAKITAQIQAGLLQASEVSFGLKNNFITAQSESFNRSAKSGGPGIPRQQFLQNENYAGRWTPQAMLAKGRGVAITDATVARLDLELNKLTEQILLDEVAAKKLGRSFDMVDDEALSFVHSHALDMLEKSLREGSLVTDQLAPEMLKYLQQIRLSGSELSVITANVAAMSKARRAEVAAALGSSIGMSQSSRQANLSGGQAAVGIKPFSSIGATGTMTAEIERIRSYMITAARQVSTEAALAGNIAFAEQYMNIRSLGGTEMQALIETNATNVGRVAVGIITAESSMFGEAGLANMKSYEVGLKEGLVKAGFSERQISKMNIEKMVSEDVPLYNAAGLTEAEAYQAGLNKGLAVPPKKRPGMGLGMGLSMGMMAGSMGISESGAKGNAAEITQGALTMGSMGAMAFFMNIPGIIAVGILLVATALGALLKYLNIMKEEAKTHAAVVAASFTASKDAVDLFGGSFQEANTQAFTFARSIDQTSTELTILQKNVQGIKDLSSDSPFKMMADSLKEMDNAKSVIGTMRQFAAIQVTKGMDPAKVKDMVTALLTYTGQLEYLDQALATIPASTKDVETATETALNKVQSAAGEVTFLSEKYKDLSEGQKRFGNALLETAYTVMNADAPMERVISTLRGMEKATKDAAQAFNLLIMAAREANQMDLANMLTQFQSLGLSPGTAVLASKLSTVVPITGGKVYNGSQLENAPITADDVQQALSNPENWKKYAQFNNADAATSYNSAKQQLSIKEQIAALNASKKKIEEQIAAQKENTAQLKKALDFAQGQTDLDIQIKDAQEHGNYLQATMLEQQKRNNAYVYKQETKKTPEEAKLELINKKLDALNAASTKISDKSAAVNLDKNKPQTAASIAAYATGMAAYFKTNPINTRGDTPETAVWVKMDKLGTIGGAKGKVDIKDFKLPSSIAPNVLQTLVGGFFGDNTAIPTLRNGKLSQEAKDYVIEHVNLKEKVDYIFGSSTYRYDAKKKQLVLMPKANKAMGGLIKGPGTGTSDSIPASFGFASGGMLSVSNGEYIQRASSVAKYGTGFMDAVNSGTYSGGDVTNNVSVTVNGADSAGNYDKLADVVAQKVMNTLTVINNKNNKSNTVRV